MTQLKRTSSSCQISSKLRFAFLTTRSKSWLLKLRSSRGQSLTSVAIVITELGLLSTMLSRRLIRLLITILIRMREWFRLISIRLSLLIWWGSKELRWRKLACLSTAEMTKSSTLNATSAQLCGLNKEKKPLSTSNVEWEDGSQENAAMIYAKQREIERWN